MDEYFRMEDPADWFGHTTVHPLGIAAVVLLSIVLFVVPRRWAFVPFVLLACFVSSAQRVVVFGLDFDFLRILVLAGTLRVLVRGEVKSITWNWIDTCLSAFVAINATVYSILHDESGALINRLGWAYDALGFYFLFRLFFQGAADPRRVAKTFAVVALPVAAFFAVEYATHRNVFGAFGGVPEFTWIRDGRLRCQGPFAHPIIAGVFWASILPIIVALWWSGGRGRTWAVVGTLGTLAIVMMTNASTSIIAVAFGAVGMAAFPLRRSMGVVRVAAVVLLVGLHLSMKAPVWHLLARATVLDASTGWHRFFVIDQSLKHLSDWWLLGTITTEGWNVTDITNEYVWIGIEGGAFALLAFLAMIGFSFRKLGKDRERTDGDLPVTRMTWALGCCLFVHCTNFIAVSYFAQSRMAWYLLLALIASQAPSAGRPVVRAPQPLPQVTRARGGVAAASVAGDAG